MTITTAGRDSLAAVFPGHIEAVQELLFAPLDDDDHFIDLTRVRGKVSAHLRAAPPRSARSRRQA